MKKKRFADGGMSSGISGGLPPIRSDLTPDQKAGVNKIKKLKETYGPSQDERDRMERESLGRSTQDDQENSAVYTSPDGKSGSMGPIKKMAKGGSASSRADGCCTKGKTKGRMV